MVAGGTTLSYTTFEYISVKYYVIYILDKCDCKNINQELVCTMNLIQMILTMVSRFAIIPIAFQL